MRVELEKIKFGFQQVASKYFLDSSVDVHENYMLDSFEFQVKGYLFGERQPDINIEYPRDWWQSFKDRWFPNRLLAKYPVIKKYHTLKRSIVYPYIKVSLPGNYHTLVCDYISGVKFPERDDYSELYL
jgi:hypothetical protein